MRVSKGGFYFNNQNDYLQLIACCLKQYDKVNCAILSSFSTVDHKTSAYYFSKNVLPNRMCFKTLKQLKREQMEKSKEGRYFLKYLHASFKLEKVPSEKF